MNKKGFTLVELLSVIVLLGLVLTIGTLSVGSIKNKINNNMFTSKLDIILTSAKTWGGDHKDKIGSDTYITVKELIDSKYLKTDETDESIETQNKSAILYDNDKKNVNELNVKVYIENSRVYACIEKNAAKTRYSNIPWDEFASSYYCV